MNRSIVRRALRTASVLAAGSTALAAGNATAEDATTSASPPCHTIEGGLYENGNETGWGGDAGIRVLIANKGTSPCTVTGYLPIANARRKRPAACHSCHRRFHLFPAGSRVHPIVLEPGRHAAADLAWTIIDNNDPSGVRAQYLNVTVAGAPTAQIAFRITNMRPS